MLRFIRKFQLLILVVGGSLLMVVFLLQPILTRLSPSPLKAKIAKLDDGTSYTREDGMRATIAMNLLKRVNPRALGPREAGGLGLDDSSDSNRSLHWLMLVKQAQKAGFIGEPGDGVSWINELAQLEALIQARTEVQKRVIAPNEAQQRMIDLAPQIAEIMNRNARLSASNAGGTMDDVYRILAQTRGIYRLFAAMQTVPTFSDVNAIHAAHDAYDSVAINAVLLDSSLATDAVAEPTDEQLQAFFDVYKAQSPSDNDYRIGYTQPTRIQLGWLTLDKNVFMNAVIVDRVELNKIWRKDREQYPGDFALEKFNLERQYRSELAAKMMVYADRVIRAQVLATTKGLSKSNGILTLPEDWESRRPHLEEIASLVVEKVNEEFSVELPRPSVTLIGDRWLNANAIASLPGYGQSTYRIGSRQLPVVGLPQFFELTVPNTTGLDVQVGLPMVDPASEDQIGNRYYAVVLGARTQGPADSIEDVTREQVVNDYKSVEGYKLLFDRMDEFSAAIVSNGALAQATDLALAIAPDPAAVTRPGVLRNILVQRDTINRGALAAFVDPRLNTQAFRTQVLEAGSRLDPLTTPESAAISPIPVVVALPSSRSIAIAMVVAPRPVTIEKFRTIARTVSFTAAQRELVDASTDLENPFSFEALSERYGMTKLNVDKDELDEAAKESAPQADKSTEEG